MDYINVHIGGVYINWWWEMNAWAKNFVVKDFIHLIFNEKQPHLFYMNNMCLCKHSQEAKLIEQRNFS